jgi:hypothetical protein
MHDQRQRALLEFQMAVPGKGHEDVGGKQHQDRQQRRERVGIDVLLQMSCGSMVGAVPAFPASIAFDFKNAKARRIPATPS